MSLKVPVFKVHLTVADQNTTHYCDYNLTLAHDPELGFTNLFLKIAIFSYLSHLEIEFVKEVFMEERPLFWKKGFDDQIQVCANYGIQDSKQVKMMGHHSKDAYLFLQDSPEEMNWFAHQEHALKKFKNINVYKVESELDEDLLATLITRSFSPSVSIDGEEEWIAIGDLNLPLRFVKLT